MQGGAANNLVNVAADAAPGFAVGSIAAGAVVVSAKSEMYFTPESLFGGREVALGEVATISYWTKTGATHGTDPRDWALAIYTKPYTGDLSTPAWYGDRIGAEPYFSSGINDPANAWNEWRTAAGQNQLRFFESTAGAPGANFGTYADPDFASSVSGTALSGSRYAGHKILYLSLQTGSTWANGFTGKVDGVRVELTDGSVATINFEPDLPACTATCYVNASGGNDAGSGSTMADAKKTIQAALNQVSANGAVRVLPGTYNEVAPGSAPTSILSTYQFGLFFASAKPGITLMGVTAGDVPITNAGLTLATINTNATNNFGYSGIFVEADNTTITGVTIGTNLPSNNKAIEVVANNFTLSYSTTAIPGGGAVYLSEFSATAGTVQSYHFLGNHFNDATQIAISSGAGQIGSVLSREIKNNTFALGAAIWPAISFNGAGGPAWFTKPVGGAVITGNTFTGGGEQYIRARGTYTESEFNWASFWQNNSYDKATVALAAELAFDVRAFGYANSYSFTNVRRIGATVQGEIDHTVAGDVVLAKAGTYPENVTIPRALTLKGAGIASTVLQGTGGVGEGIALAGGLSNVTIQQLTAQGYAVGVRMLTGPLSNITLQDVAAIGNTSHGIWVQAFGITNMAFTRVNASGNNAVGGLAGRGLWIINGVKTGVSITGGTFNNNGLVGIDVSDGSVTGLAITGNTVTGNGDSGIGVLGAGGTGANLVANNIVTNNGRFGIEMKIPAGNGAASGAGSVVVSNNTVTRTTTATDAHDYAGIAVYRRSVDLLSNPDQPSGVFVSGNTVSGFLRKPASTTGDGFGIIVEGTGHVVTKNVVSSNDVGIQIQSGNTANIQSTSYFDRGDASSSSALINRNSITSNTLYDIRNVGAGLTDATCNWYGVGYGSAAGNAVWQSHNESVADVFHPEWGMRDRYTRPDHHGDSALANPHQHSHYCQRLHQRPDNRQFAPPVVHLVA